MKRRKRKERKRRDISFLLCGLSLALQSHSETSPPFSSSSSLHHRVLEREAYKYGGMIRTYVSSLAQSARPRLVMKCDVESCAKRKIKKIYIILHKQQQQQQQQQLSLVQHPQTVMACIQSVINHLWHAAVDSQTAAAAASRLMFEQLLHRDTVIICRLYSTTT